MDIDEIFSRAETKTNSENSTAGSDFLNVAVIAWQLLSDLPVPSVLQQQIEIADPAIFSDYKKCTKSTNVYTLCVLKWSQLEPWGFKCRFTSDPYYGHWGKLNIKYKYLVNSSFAINYDTYAMESY